MKDQFTRNTILTILGLCISAIIVYMVMERGRGGFPGSSGSSSVSASKIIVETTVRFYFSNKDVSTLVEEKRTFPHPENPVEFAKMIVNGLIGGPENGGVRTIPSETTLKALFLMKDGTAVVDFSKEISEKHPGGAMAEYLTVMSVVQSLTSNIPDIKKVKLLIDGKDTETLAGHIDLDDPLVGDMSLVK
jgi:spore germination protein GerM